MADALDAVTTQGAEAPADGLATIAAAARRMFGDALPQAEKYAVLLAGSGVEQGVVGPAEAGRIWDRHLLNCGAVARLIPARCSLVDLGSGGGLPGLVLAILLPSARVTLLEPMARRAEFLGHCVAELGLANADVVRARAEEMAGQMAADVVTARAVAPLDKLAGMGVGLARPGGRVLAIKGSSAEAELARALPVLVRLGISDARVVRATGPEDSGEATVVTFTAPEHRPGGAGSQRAAGQAGGRGRGPVSGRRDRVGLAGKNLRPNSRRGGG